jgi:hypothetical protein
MMTIQTLASIAGIFMGVVTLAHLILTVWDKHQKNGSLSLD